MPSRTSTFHLPSRVGPWSLGVLLALLIGGTTAPARATPAVLQHSLEAYAAGHLVDARRGFEALARQGMAVARFNLAVMHLRGEVPGGDRQRAQRARVLLEQAARQGFVTAMYTLGEAWEGGQFGPGGRGNASALARSLAWYERAALAGSADAQLAAGTAYYLGRGAAQNRATAARWYREAAKAGDVGAQYLVAAMYETGDGVTQDLRLARYWYGVAAENGDLAARGKLQQLQPTAAADAPVPAAGPAGPTERP